MKEEDKEKEEDNWGVRMGGRMKRTKGGEGGGGRKKIVERREEKKQRKNKRRREDHEGDKDLLVSSH